MTLISERPTSGPAGPYRFPPVVRRDVAGGKIVAAHLPGHPLAVASLLLDAGAGREPAGLAGLTGVLAKAIEEGTTTRDSAAFALALEGLGTELSVSTDWDSFRVGVQVPVERLPAAVTLLAEAVRAPKLDPADVARVRDDEATALKMYWANPGPAADAALAADLFDAATRIGQPLYGDPASAAAVSVDDVLAFHAEQLSRAGTLLVVGDLDRIDLDALGELAFAGTNSDALAVPTPLGVAPRSNRKIILLDRPGAVQSTLRLGHTAPHRTHPDFVPLSLAATVLGGAFTSRLNHLLREVRGYTYGIRGSFDQHRGFGSFEIAAGVQTAVTAAALTDAIAEVARTQDEGVTEAELAVARDWRAGGLTVGLQTPAAIAGALARLVVHGLPDDYHATLRAELLAATVDEVSTAARTHLWPDGLTLVVDGDAAVIRDDLAKSGLGELIIG